MQDGLQLGVPSTVPGYPTGNKLATGLPWTPATDGLRNLTDVVHEDGTATMYALPSIVSGNGDQGAAPHQPATMTDSLAAASLPGNATFTPVRAAGFGEVLRGDSWTPGTQPSRD